MASWGLYFIHWRKKKNAEIILEFPGGKQAAHGSVEKPGMTMLPDSNGRASEHGFIMQIQQYEDSVHDISKGKNTFPEGI
jgi:hypothetical protein